MKIQDATFCLIDTETSGVEKDDDLLEVAAHLYHGIEPGKRFTTLVKPTKPIPPEASGIHGLVDDMFDEAPERYEVMLQLAEFIPDGAIVVAHNAPFDLGVLGWDRPHLCSERMAHHLTPEAPNFKLATLRYFYGFHHLEVGSAHRADADLLVTAAVFFHLIARYRAWAEEVCAGDLDRLEKAEQVETVIAWAARPYPMLKPPFGKYKTWVELLADAGYTRWMLGLPDLSPDLRWNIERVKKAHMV